MSHVEKIQRAKLSELRAQYYFTADTLVNRIDEMEDWEVKEYLQVHAETKDEFFSLLEHITYNF